MGVRCVYRRLRFQKHGDCSKSSYRKEVELDVKTARSASTEEKRILKRLEEDSLNDSPLLDDSDSEDHDGA